ncbi:N-acylneuraminate cytidylyltransferase [Candidatus Woesearchaeota archaeon]|nr:N-acylneuraminate cytidylyltransferase [Candidatus Woesearchaeota archaeon]MCF8013129.1 N-acylneuraminate cytidylyltransferase [Candidatus Woesearchaeota archaeon]
MYKNKKIIAIIPARGGSKGIPKKNIKLIAGKQLIAWTIDQVKCSKYIDQVYVSTDDNEIETTSMELGAQIIRRPDEISGDTASTESALIHASNELQNDFDYMCLFQCTSPIRYSKQIDDAIEQMFEEKADSLLTTYKNDSFLWTKEGKSINYDFKNRPRRQDKEWEFVENGSFYIFKKEILENEKNRLGGKISIYEMPKWMSFEIDESFDFEIVEFLMKNKFIKSNFEDKKNKIKMILFDVDGVFTDGSVYQDEKGNETVKFSRIDGKGIELIRNEKIIGVISAENSEIVKKRMEKLRIKEIHLGIKNKLQTYEEIKNKYNLKDEEICFCGDDIQDIPVLEKVGFSACPKNARKEVKAICNYISEYEGGNGFVRDLCDILK